MFDLASTGSTNTTSIIAVHGLNPRSKNDREHAWDTWRKPSGPQGRLWLRDDLPQHIPEARIFLYEYNSTAVYSKDRDTFIGKANELLEALRIERDDIESRPILFLGHSMGGLLIKQALINAHNNPKYTPIKHTTTGLAFFATPHHGGDWMLVSLGGVVTKIATSVGFQKGDDVLETLKNGSIFSEIMQEHWRHQLLKYDIISFWGVLDKIVPAESARFGMPGDRENVVKLNADHSGVCKFGPSLEDQDNLKLVRGNIKDLYKSALKTSHQLVDSSNYIPSYPLTSIMPTKTFVQRTKLREQKHQNSVEEYIQGQQRRETVDWLCADLPYDDYDIRIRDKLEGSCEWILEQEEYKEWKTPSCAIDTPECLWIYGKAGMGKSFIAATIVKDLQQTSSLPFAFYFAMHDQAHKREPLSILRSWTLQLVSRSVRAFEVLQSIRKGKETRKITESELWGLFSSCLKIIGRCFLLIDGYDETSNELIPRRSHVEGAREIFLQEVFQSIKGTKACIVLISRDEVDIRQQITDFGPTIPATIYAFEICPENTSKDIACFSRHIVNKRLRSSKFDHNNVKEELAEHLSARSQGMFLWVQLSGAALYPDRTMAQLIRDVSEPPIGLSNAYARDLQRILKLKPKEKARAIQILQWTLFATRPLSVLELTEALLIDTDKNMLDRLDYPEFIGVEYINFQILRLCGSLVEFKEEDSVDTILCKGGGSIHLAHFSVKEFILTENEHGIEFNESDANYELATVCLSYLMSQDVEQFYRATELPRPSSIYDRTNSGPMRQAYENFKKDNGFLAYAASQWVMHARAYESSGKQLLPVLRDLLDERNDSNLRALLFCYCGEISFDDWYREYKDEPTLSVMSRFGLTEGVRYILEKRPAGFVKRDRSDFCALYEACCAGHIQTIELLFQYFTADEWMEYDIGFYTDIEFILGSCCPKLIDVLDTLVTHGVDPEYISSNFLQQHMDEDFDLFEWFLDNGADPNFAVSYGLDFPGDMLWLQSLADGLLHADTLRMVEMLVERGACVNCPLTPPISKRDQRSDMDVCRDEFSYTLCGQTFSFAQAETDSICTTYRCTRDIHSLIEASSPCQNGNRLLEYRPGTPLQFAAWHGRESLVRLLIERGADPQASGGIILQDGNYQLLCRDGSALELAREKGHSGVMEILQQSIQSSPFREDFLRSSTVKKFRSGEYSKGEKERAKRRRFE